MKKLIALVLLASPLSLLAAPIENINQVASRATQIGDLAIKLAISLAVVWIVISVVRFLIIGAANEEKRTAAKQSIIWGVVGLFVILSIWGIVFILTQSFSTRNRTPIEEINKIGTLPPPPLVETGGSANDNNDFRNVNNKLWDAPSGIEDRNAGMI